MKNNKMKLSEHINENTGHLSPVILNFFKMIKLSAGKGSISSNKPGYFVALIIFSCTIFLSSCGKKFLEEKRWF